MLSVLFELMLLLLYCYVLDKLNYFSETKRKYFGAQTYLQVKVRILNFDQSVSVEK